jgi:hypothetical protein
MSPMYEVTGYDRKTGRLMAFYDVGARRLSSVKKAAGVSSSDDGLGAYPLNRRAVRGNFCCTRSNAFQSSTQLYLPVAGLVPATHVFTVHSADPQEGVDGRAKPGQGDPALCKQRYAQPDSIPRTALRSTGIKYR